MEILIYVVLVAILAVFLSGSIVVLLQGRGVVGTQSGVHDTLRLAEEKISQDVRIATAITTPAAAGTSSATLVMTVGVDTITYSLSAGVVTRQVNADAPISITPATMSILSLNFLRFENTNTILSKTVVSVQATIEAGSASSGGLGKGYVETKQFTVTMQ